MKHSRGTTGSRNNPGSLIVLGRGGRTGGLASYIYWRTRVRWQESPPRLWDQTLVACSFPVQHSETVLTPPPGERPRRRLGRWDKCDWSLTIYPHTLRGIRGYKVIPEVAAYTQSH